MLTRRGALRQRGMDLPKIQTNIAAVEAVTTPVHDVDADLAEFIQVDYSCLEFLTPTGGGSSSTATPETNSSASTPYAGDEDVPWPRPMDRDIHGRADLKQTAPKWAIQLRWVLSLDFEQDSSEQHRWDESTALPWGQRRPSVVDDRFHYGRKIQRGRRPSDFSLMSVGMQLHDDNVPFELVLCSEEDSLYSN
ncbi:hypothetical protein J7T55_015601 [Diaporthe amygdali]|uniref:uncharacterized protein n=1 Tax=Phomopsis amygdali TaxID=1214568 RepID=UPI0022FDE1F4|nr:uncharacterized protein J7T55_015601 [Diaporthe amygdali]KAJ0120866.1 hypothetical protein J7T55_015601 [Diaporthe amygdali]